jgi:hypothetical protein
MLPEAVRVKPATVTDWPALKAENVTVCCPPTGPPTALAGPFPGLYCTALPDRPFLDAGRRLALTTQWGATSEVVVVDLVTKQVVPTGDRAAFPGAWAFLAAGGGWAKSEGRHSHVASNAGGCSVPSTAIRAAGASAKPMKYASGYQYQYWANMASPMRVVARGWPPGDRVATHALRPPASRRPVAIRAPMRHMT